MRRGSGKFVAGFLALPVLVYLVFVIGPYLQAFYLALTDWRGVSGSPEFIGLGNFERLLGDATFWKAVSHHAILLVVLPLATLGIALFFAFLINAGARSGTRGVWGSRFYQAVFFFPQVLAVAAVGVLFQAVYRPDSGGILNGLLNAVGLDNVGWLTDPDLALWSIIAVLVWQAVGFYVVLFSAGMAAIPKEIHEAAALDGAGRGRMFFSVTLPLLWDSLQAAWVYLGIAAFDGFALVAVLSVNRGGPDGATTVLPLEIWRTAFSFSKFGYAAAMGVALFFLTLTFALLALRVTRRERIDLA
ncbi:MULTISPECIES: carbohydrate ABC transporter permease [Actinokineospora]|uniref:Sugar ABC transporter permease n=1 Tax=Actinokineospora fastidiosa TaxID=1816 RepID=A0A918LDH9_9PSEU|nr:MULTISPECIES: sugar ABC transporter permease [Actinokineospora]UVS79969.1 Lactose transport system permease protein LacF [Actinokineospora sp. UTMC 2448]GGS32153.1 sugar ABC transporter permease [Actinokineospora fastidiosa]